MCASRLRDLLRDKSLSPASESGGGRRGGFGGGRGARTPFEVAVPAHSFRAFQSAD
jgi:hypothetical protein